MCDESDYVVGVISNQVFRVIYYVSRTLNEAQFNYVTMTKELLAIIFAFDKSHPYLI